MTDDLKILSQIWIECKQAEEKSIAERRAIEDRMKSLIGVAENFEGTETAKPDGFVIKITGRATTKVDEEVLKQLIEESGIEKSVIDSLFRWKAEVNKRAWDRADESLTAPLAAAITTKVGRASFSIETVNME